jgi:hypothetical protein
VILSINATTVAVRKVQLARSDSSLCFSTMRPSLFAVGLTAFPGALAAGGVWVINQCPWDVLMKSDGPNGRSDPPQTIEAGTGYFEAYQGKGRAIKLSRYPKTSPILVFGYSYVEGDSNVWYAVDLLPRGKVCR